MIFRFCLAGNGLRVFSDEKRIELVVKLVRRKQKVVSVQSFKIF